MDRRWMSPNPLPVCKIRKKFPFRMFPGEIFDKVLPPPLFCRPAFLFLSGGKRKQKDSRSGESVEICMIFGENIFHS